METKKSNPTRVWHARNLVSVAAKMTSSSIEPCRLCRSAAVTQYWYRASLYLVTILFCESTRYLQLRTSGTKTIEKRVSCYFSWWVTSWSSLWVTSVTSDGEKRGEDVVCVCVIGSLDKQGYTITLENICPRVCLAVPTLLPKFWRSAAQCTAVIASWTSLTYNF
jgi:hypothetical protein